jgi:hypothetical protein
VAIVTTGGIVAPLVTEGDYSQMVLSVVSFAVAAALFAVFA